MQPSWEWTSTFFIIQKAQLVIMLQQTDTKYKMLNFLNRNKFLYNDTEMGWKPLNTVPMKWSILKHYFKTLIQRANIQYVCLLRHNYREKHSPMNDKSSLQYACTGESLTHWKSHFSSNKPVVALLNQETSATDICKVLIFSHSD